MRRHVVLVILLCACWLLASCKADANGDPEDSNFIEVTADGVEQDSTTAETTDAGTPTDEEFTALQSEVATLRADLVVATNTIATLAPRMDALEAELASRPKVHTVTIDLDAPNTAATVVQSSSDWTASLTAYSFGQLDVGFAAGAFENGVPACTCTAEGAFGACSFVPQASGLSIFAEGLRVAVTGTASAIPESYGVVVGVTKITIRCVDI